MRKRRSARWLMCLGLLFAPATKSSACTIRRTIEVLPGATGMAMDLDLTPKKAAP